MAPEDLGLPDSLVQLSFAVQEILAAIAAEAGVSVTGLRLIGILRDREPTMQQLAQVLDLEKSSVSGLIDRAERRGLVARSRSPTDARAIHVRLTPRGHDVSRHFAGQVARRVDVLLGPLSDRDRAQLSRLATRSVRTGT